MEGEERAQSTRLEDIEAVACRISRGLEIWEESLEEFCASDALSLDGLRERLAAIPPIFLERHPFLCSVCANELVTLEIVTYILDVVPGAADAPSDFEYGHPVRTSSGYPLHFACANEECPDAVIELLVEKSESTTLKHLCIVLGDGVPSGEYDYDYVEGTPIHYYLARESNIDIGMVKMLVEACPEALNTADEETRYTPLHVYLCNSELDMAIVRYLAEREPHSAQWPCGYDAVPLHLACENGNANPTVVEFLLSLFPEAVHHRNICRALPIHVLCQNRELNDSASCEICNMLVEREPGMLKEIEDDGELPIHCAVKHKSLEFCKLLLEAHPESIGIESGYGATPFHSACDGGCLDVVKYLLELRPEDLFAASEWDGRFPIHFAASCWYPERRAEIVRYLLQKDPEGATRVTGEGQKMPLHLACGYYECLESVKVLFDSHPWAIIAEDSDGKTPVDLARRGGSLNSQNSAMVGFLKFSFGVTEKPKIWRP